MVGGMPAGSAAPAHRAVVLGASNVVLDLATVVAAARQALAGPLDFLAAVGHGRGYVRPCRVLGRTLPAIVDCGLWAAWEARPPLPTYALLTDIGNDLLYGAGVEPIADGVAACLERLAGRCRQVVMTELPLASLDRLTPRRFRLLRTLFFSFSRLTWESVRERSVALNRRVVALAGEFGAVVRQPRADWYGWDPIHVRRAVRPRVWQEYVSAWCPQAVSAAGLSAPHGTWREWWYLSTRAAERRRTWGAVRWRAQPSGWLRDGTQISLF